MGYSEYVHPSQHNKRMELISAPHLPKNSKFSNLLFTHSAKCSGFLFLFVRSVLRTATTFSSSKWFAMGTIPCSSAYCATRTLLRPSWGAKTSVLKLPYYLARRRKLFVGQKRASCTSFRSSMEPRPLRSGQFLCV